MDRNLGINLVRVTEAAALGGAMYLGKGDKNRADKAAVDNMRNMFDTIDIEGVVVIGEGEMDEAPMLYIGEEIGTKGMGYQKVDIAVDPIDGTNAVAKGLNNAIAVCALAPRGAMLAAPDMYMDKLAAGPKAKGVIDIDASVEDNLRNVAKALNKNLSDLTATMLDRDRHQYIIDVCRELGVRVKLFQDGDVDAAIATCFEDSGVDIMFGMGGAPEGVIAAAAIKCLGGDMQARLKPMNDEEIARCKKMGAAYETKLTIDDLVAGEDIYFAATGISDGEFTRGVRYLGENKASTQTLMLRGKTGTIRYIDAVHQLDKKPEYAK
ncbi:MAG: class II fructose-bisphosphatase [Firmicutes bacterium]|jgi:fructose-1,6-bisphosphatase II|nr:class II fructose-bisphosphatase [Bacillota bacterium]